MPLVPYQQLINFAPPWSTTAGATLASSNALTIVSPSSPDLLLPAYFFEPGTTLRCTCSGTYASASSPTLTLGVYYNGTTTALATTGALTTPASGDFFFQVNIQCRTQGTSGTVVASGWSAGIVSASTVALMPASGLTTTTINTTTANTLVAGGTWSVNSASNTMTVQQWLVEQLL